MQSWSGDRKPLSLLKQYNEIFIFYTIECAKFLLSRKGKKRMQERVTEEKFLELTILSTVTKQTAVLFSSYDLFKLCLNSFY